MEAAETISKEVAKKAAETEEAVPEVTAETIPKEMAKNVTEEVAETEIVTMKMAETEEVVKSVDIFGGIFSLEGGGTHLKS